MLPSFAHRLARGILVSAVLTAGCTSATDHPLFGDDDAPALISSGAAPPPAGDAETGPILPSHPSRAEYLAHAALVSPGLAAAWHRWQAALERVPQARTLPDPQLTYGWYVREVETRVGPMQHQVAVSQTLPWLGTLEGREDAAARAANAAYQRYEGVKLDLFERVGRGLDELWYLDRGIAIAEEELELVRQLEALVRERYRLDDAGHADLARLQLEVARLEDRRRQLIDARPGLVAGLNALLDRPALAAIPSPDPPPDAALPVDRAALDERLGASSPALLALDEELRRARHEVELARLAGYPDVTVGLGYTFVDDASGDVEDRGKDPVLATFTLRLPLWREKYDAKEREAIATRLSLANERAEETNRLRAELHATLVAHDDAVRRSALYRDTLIPKAEEAYRSTLGGFQAGTSDLLDLLEVERTLIELRLGRARARADRSIAHATLERLLGTELDRAEETP